MPESLGEHVFARQLTPIRAEPADEAEQVTQALPGEPLTIEERAGAWARVRTAYDYPGWTRAEALAPAVEPEWVAHARSYLGSVYEWGGMTAAGIDCSGLVHMSFRAAGRLVPRDADQQEEAGVEVDDPRPGDLVTYGDPGKPADHIAFWLGEGRILHSTRREGVDGVVEEVEPEELRARRRKVFRL
jgi:gamma-D-glutamyl-L-lysine dipeptidyl-peptidase